MPFNANPRAVNYYKKTAMDTSKDIPKTYIQTTQRRSVISIIIPSHNEPEIFRFIQKVEDEIYPHQIITYNDRYSKGKGYALRKALEHATGDWFIFIDGDFDIAPGQINKLLPYLSEFDVVVGKKQLSGAPHRKLITFLSRIYIKLMFNVGVDTQTGIKAFNYKPEWITDGFAFDIEILARAKREGKRIVEVPVTAHISGRVGLRSVWITLKDSIKIWLALLSL
jgi:cellulose synthase/poly-beta-1,6-N-acetylglucosamine synthase-like glycosyltransferase